MRSRRGLVAVAVAGLVVPVVLAGADRATAGPAATAAGTTAAGTVSADGVTATVTPSAAVLDDGRIRRTWSIGPGGTVETTGLAGAGRSDWVRPGPDFTITVDGVPTSAAAGWTLTGVTAQHPPARPDRPGSGAGAALLFRYVLGAAGLPGVELDRLVVLHPGTAVVETSTTLVSLGAPARVSAYTLDAVTAADPGQPAEVQAYNGGSDWRDDYRHVSHPAGAFDAEGELLRLGTDSGLFLLAQRRGGVMSRAGRDADGRSWVGVDWARDLFDFGPLETDPPTYNRLDNPAYPAPVRARLLPPLGRLDLGTAYLGLYSGGGQQAAAEFARAFVGVEQPDFPRTVGLNTFHPWNHGPGLADANLRHQVDVAARLGVETFMLDDQWQGGPGGESGDWRWDPARFPDGDGDGVPDFVDYLHAHGMSLGLWMSPLEFNMASTTYAAHPDWACAPLGDASAQVQDDAGLGVWDATNPQLQDHLAAVVHRLVRDDGVREFKFDFMAWLDCASSAGVHDYADYEQAFVDLVHRMQAENPGVTFELDETNDQRSWPFESAQIGPSWFDNGHLHGSTRVAKLLHDVWSAAPWVPAWSTGVGLYDGTLAAPYTGAAGVDFLFPLAMLTHVTFWTDLTTLSPAEQDETAWWIGWYRDHRDSLGPAVYELTGSDPLDGTSWAVWQPWDGTRGYVFAFRQDGAPPRERVSLQGLAPQARYRLTDVRTGRQVAVRSGADLAAGLDLSLPRASAQVLAVTPVP